MRGHSPALLLALLPFAALSHAESDTPAAGATADATADASGQAAGDARKVLPGARSRVTRETSRRPRDLPSDAELAAAGVRIGEIRIRPLEIFDTSIPEENTGRCSPRGWRCRRSRAGGCGSRRCARRQRRARRRRAGRGGVGRSRGSPVSGRPAGPCAHRPQPDRKRLRWRPLSRPRQGCRSRHGRGPRRAAERAAVQGSDHASAQR